MSFQQGLLRFQFASDVHLEYLTHPKLEHLRIEPKAPVLVLAGDIGRPGETYAKFLQMCSSDFDHVIVVAGNHEFYQSARPKNLYDEVLVEIKNICSVYHNVHFLEKDSVEISGVRFLGTTLWSHIPPEKWAQIQQNMHDYTKIYRSRPPPDAVPRGKKNWGTVEPSDTSSWHQKSVEWLEAELPKSELPTVVITHHAPTPSHTDKRRFSEQVREAYCSNLSQLFKPPIVGWISGHVHTCRLFRTEENGPLFACNTMGYPQNRVADFDPKRVMLVTKEKMIEI